MMKNTLFILFLSAFLVALLAFGYYVRSLTETSNSQWVNKKTVTPLGMNALTSSSSEDWENDSIYQLEKADVVAKHLLGGDTRLLKNKGSEVSIAYSESKGSVIGANNEQWLTTKNSDLSILTKDSPFHIETLTDTESDTPIDRTREANDVAEVIASSVYSGTSSSPDNVLESSSLTQAEDIEKVLAPRGIWHKVIDRKITLYWNAADKAEGYRVSHKNARGSEIANFDVLDILSFVHTNGDATIPQYYQISTLGADLESAPSATYVVKPPNIRITNDSANL